MGEESVNKALITIGTIVLLGEGVCGAEQIADHQTKPVRHTITYRVLGNGHFAKVSYTNASGGTNSSMEQLPWKTSIPAARGFRAYVSAQARGARNDAPCDPDDPSGPCEAHDHIWVVIEVDGKPVQKSEAFGEDAIASAGGVL
jgi:hypothetical protein